MSPSLRAAIGELLPVVAFLAWAFLLLATMRGAWGAGRSVGPLIWEDARRIPSETLRRPATGVAVRPHGLPAGAEIELCAPSQRGP